ncbi:MAG: tetratricopeptide repeat protein [Candidatus Sulfotelmatobacter sp.]|jgi:Flp pilus assembly protein TadD
MSWRTRVVAGVLGITFGWASQARAGELKITIPRRSHLTPVQRLNQEGVEEIQKRKYEKAESLFYKAYLLDPEDPFTLNNLGYISELKGQIDRALNFYSLAGQEATDAAIAKASLPRVKGRTLKEALAIPDLELQINHDNVEAVRLLAQSRGPEADLLLQKALNSDPNNVFTLNNMGVAKEMEGESQEALKYYDSAAAENSSADAIVTLNRSWRGKPVSEMAARNARDLRNKLDKEMTAQLQIAELNARGVAAVNRNELVTAEKDFRQAYTLDPNNAFAVNNFGYLAELEGDRETAQFFYDKAQTLSGANTPVGLASRSSAQGMKLSQVASGSDADVEAKLQQQRDARREHQQPVLLLRRDNTVVQEPPVPSASTTPAPQ